MMGLILQLLSLAVDIYIGIIILQVVIQWLVIFKVINVENPQAQNLLSLLAKATDPVYKPLRQYVPPIGGLDLTPLIVILGLNLLRGMLFALLV
ncbi:MAG: hypothetical protein CMH26_03835 [Micavibrio sp.]|nr:hypothetical protein [Micavibrio sp.]